jgi:hypothetical protein
LPQALRPPNRSHVCQDEGEKAAALLAHQQRDCAERRQQYPQQAEAGECRSGRNFIDELAARVSARTGSTDERSRNLDSATGSRAKARYCPIAGQRSAVRPQKAPVLAEELVGVQVVDGLGPIVLGLLALAPFVARMPSSRDQAISSGESFTSSIQTFSCCRRCSRTALGVFAEPVSSGHRNAFAFFSQYGRSANIADFSLLVMSPSPI